MDWLLTREKHSVNYSGRNFPKDGIKAAWIERQAKEVLIPRLLERAKQRLAVPMEILREMEARDEAR